MDSGVDPDVRQEAKGSVGQRYSVRSERTADGLRAHTQVRQFTLETGAHRGDPDAGPNAVETLLTAIGSCLLTGLGMVAEGSHIPLDAVAIDLEAERSDQPPRITSVTYAIHLDSSAPDERLARLVELSERNSTVLGSLRGCGFAVEGRWDRAGSRAGSSTSPPHYDGADPA